jgi:hypothetical protein
MIISNDLTNPSATDLIVQATVPADGYYRVRFFVSATADAQVEASAGNPITTGSIVIRVPASSSFLLDLGTYLFAASATVSLRMHANLTGVVDGSVFLDPVSYSPVA